MNIITCHHCRKDMAYGEEAKPMVCPFCGAPYGEKDPLAPSPLELRLREILSPKEKYALIQKALAENPQDFYANRALLFHGRLHERRQAGIHFFAGIKCHLFSIFEMPEAYDEETITAKVEELFRDPQLIKTCALSPDGADFLPWYIRRLALTYIDLFIASAKKNTHVGFGFTRSPKALAQRCAQTVCHMMQGIEKDEKRLTNEEKALLLFALREGYGKVFPAYIEMI